MKTNESVPRAQAGHSAHAASATSSRARSEIQLGFQISPKRRGFLATRCREGFTLIELLVVLAIIGILASLLLPAVSKAAERGRMAKCTSNVRQMALALTMYVDDQGYYPPLLYPSSQPDPWLMVSWYAALSPYLSNWKASSSPYRCPSFKYDFLTNGEPVYFNTGPYGYNGNGRYSLSPGEILPEHLPAGGLPKSVFVKETQVIAPARMIALGDSQLLSGAPPPAPIVIGSTMLTYVSITERAKWRGFPAEMKATKRRHFGRHQIGFCDGHVESIKYETLFADTPEVRRLWHRDHESHDPN